MYLPHKLILKYGEIALLDGDVVHGDDINPSGLRGHAYIADDVSVEGAKNTVVDKDGKHLEDTCTIPYTDYLDIKLHKITKQKKLVST